MKPLLIWLALATLAAAQPVTTQELLERAQATHSSALVILNEGRPVVEEYFGGQAHPIESMSVTKSIVNLAVGRLWTQGKLRLEQPVADFYPEWRQGKKAGITILQLLNHTSGLQNVPSAGQEIYPAPDFVQLALAAELSTSPGAAFAYNNKACNLLAGLVERASGRKLDEYLGEELFSPMEIHNFRWTRDQAGNPHGMSGFQVLPLDLAKLGQLVLDRGQWQGQRLIDEEWFDLSLKPGQAFVPNCGLLWWLDREVLALDLDQEQVELFAPHLPELGKIQGSYASEKEFQGALRRLLGADWASRIKEATGAVGRPLTKKRLGSGSAYRADGYLGQYIVVCPLAKTVGVRMVEGGPNYDQVNDGFIDFSALMMRYRP